MNSLKHIPTGLLAVLILFVVGMLMFPSVSMAVTCEVPTQLATIQDAVNDPDCSEIILLDQVYDESVRIDRSLTMFGPAPGGATIRGAVSVEDSEVLVVLENFAIESGCPKPGLQASLSAEIQALGVLVTSSASFPCTLREQIFSNTLNPDGSFK